jgi:hypothetical protein
MALQYRQQKEKFPAIQALFQYLNKSASFFSSYLVLPAIITQQDSKMIDIPPHGINGPAFIPLPEKFYVFKGGIFWILSFFKIQNSMSMSDFSLFYSLRIFIGATMSCLPCLICVRCFVNL